MNTLLQAKPSVNRCQVLTSEHLADLESLSKAVWDDLCASGHTDYAAKKSRAELSAYLGSGRALGIFHGERLVGFGYLGQTSVEYPDAGVPGMKALYDPSRTGVLCTTIVHPLRRRHGLGLAIDRARIDLAGKLGCTSVVEGITSTNTPSWHNALRGGFKLVQAGELPQSIGAHSHEKAFYFHMRLGAAGRQSFGGNTRLVDPLRQYNELRALLESGAQNTGYQMEDGQMRLMFSTPQP